MAIAHTRYPNLERCITVLVFAEKNLLHGRQRWCRSVWADFSWPFPDPQRGHLIPPGHRALMNHCSAASSLESMFISVRPLR